MPLLTFGPSKKYPSNFEPIMDAIKMMEMFFTVREKHGGRWAYEYYSYYSLFELSTDSKNGMMSEYRYPFRCRQHLKNFAKEFPLQLPEIEVSTNKKLKKILIKATKSLFYAIEDCVVFFKQHKKDMNVARWRKPYEMDNIIHRHQKEQDYLNMVLSEVVVLTNYLQLLLLLQATYHYYQMVRYNLSPHHHKTLRSSIMKNAKSFYHVISKQVKDYTRKHLYSAYRYGSIPAFRSKTIKKILVPREKYKQEDYYDPHIQQPCENIENLYKIMPSFNNISPHTLGMDHDKPSKISHNTMKSMMYVVTAGIIVGHGSVFVANKNIARNKKGLFSPLYDVQRKLITPGGFGLTGYMDIYIPEAKEKQDHALRIAKEKSADKTRALQKKHAQKQKKKQQQKPKKTRPKAISDYYTNEDNGGHYMNAPGGPPKNKSTPLAGLYRKR